MPQGYLIAPFEEGVRTDLEPWLIPENAFEEMTDAFTWRGRIRKRFGYELLSGDPLLSRLRVEVGTTDPSGDLSVNVRTATTAPAAPLAVGQIFSVTDGVTTALFTVNAGGTPAAMLSTGPGTGTFNTTNGDLVLSGTVTSSAVFWYPALPVMGLLARELSSVNLEQTVAFDQVFAYERSAGGWVRLGNGLWSGNNSQFFWGINYRGASAFQTNFYVVNFNQPDGIQYLPQGGSTWTTITPALNTATTPNDRVLSTCRVLLGFKDRLVALNTVETTDPGGVPIILSFPNRCRFSQNGDPTNASTSWLDDTPGRGGFIDAPTSEAITTAEIIKDRLIVYFEQTTWELAYTGDINLPFRWQQINNELGCESTFSVIGFDKVALGVGNRGLHSCDGMNVTRIDAKIPSTVFRIHNGSDGPRRVYGIRDYYMELVYWAYPLQVPNPTFPNRVLLYNYVNNTWAFFIDSFTSFGYFQIPSDLTWATVDDFYPSWSVWNAPWNSPTFQSAFPKVIGGNQEGFTVLVDFDKSSNSQTLYITDMTAGTDSTSVVVINHNLTIDDYVLVTDAQGNTSLNGLVSRVLSVDSADSVTLDLPSSGTYTGGGYLTRVSQLDILTKEFNPGTAEGRQFLFPYVDFYLSRTEDGEVACDYFIDSEDDDSIQSQSQGNGALLGENVLRTRPEDTSPVQNNQIRIWHRYFTQAIGQTVQLRLFLTDAQIRTLAISQAEFELHAINLFATPKGRIIG